MSTFSSHKKMTKKADSKKKSSKKDKNKEEVKLVVFGSGGVGKSA